MIIMHDPNARLDYKWPWGDWLEDDETIAEEGTIVTAPTGEGVPTVEVEPFTITDEGKSVKAWISGGTLGTFVGVTCHVKTSAGREDDRTLTLSIQER